MNMYLEITNNNELTIPKNNEISFYSNGIWIMKISEDKIIFNRENYHNASPDEFALEVIDILEKQFNVKFTRNDKSFEET